MICASCYNLHLCFLFFNSFRDQLKETEKLVDERNEARTDKYTYLHPREVPNAISVWFV